MLLLCSASARADELCRPGVKHHGAPISIDLKDANVRDVLTFLVDTAHVNLVVSDDVTGKVTLAMHHVPWDQALCVITATQHLAVSVEDNILIVTRR
jgi:type IV pilus assembly protein PilQ